MTALNPATDGFPAEYVVREVLDTDAAQALSQATSSRTFKARTTSHQDGAA
ncbi:hypothetical protein GS461_13650 [Rhodococcus hoagii]|nr:hypothetical protein [Prescottella equi]